MTYEDMCNQISIEVKLLTKKELEDKITIWLLNPELEIYAPVLQKELKKR